MFFPLKPIVLAFIGWLVFGIQTFAYADSVNQEAERRHTIQEAKEMYTDFSGKPPTASNIRRSLKIENASGKLTGEVMAALRLITLGEFKGDDLADAIIECMRRNPENRTIQTASIRAILIVDKAKGLELGTTTLRNPDTSLEDKLKVASSLASLVDDTRGYLLLRQGLLSSRPYDRTLAHTLFRNLIKLDGKPIPDEPDTKVDLKGLLKDLKASTKDSKILTELDSLTKLVDSEASKDKAPATKPAANGP